jgi:peptide/nickel transport system substrate-binding protein
MPIRYIRESDPVRPRAYAELCESLPYVPVRQFKQPFVWRSNITGVLKANTPVYWDIR